ncbi:MAG TPA: branched-chain amino acid ABC transporter permease, partial [Desulfosporosinus sp.]|nr:branched-chain amino acid ABC transporter permease [Desulfosporosinus sp.]
IINHSGGRQGEGVMDSSVISDLLIGGILRGGMYVLMAMGLSLVFGVMKIPNFAHGEFYMIGAYLCYFSVAVWHLPVPLAIVIAAIGAFAIGAVIEKATFYPLRKRSQSDWVLNSFLVTAGLSFVLQNLAQAWLGVTFKGVPQLWGGTLAIGGMHISLDRVIAFVIAMVTVVVFWLFLKKTKIGSAIRAVSEHETGAKLMGIDLNTIHTLTFALSCMLAAIAGAALLSIIPASPFMGLQPLYKSWFVVILVGLGNIEATIVGGFMVGLIEMLASYKFGAGYQDVISLSIIILVLLLKPSGLFGKKLKV